MIAPPHSPTLHAITHTLNQIKTTGSVKEGARTAASKGPADDDNDDLHVYISGEKEEDVSS